MPNEVYLTREGYNKLFDELENLRKRKPELSKEIGHAREMGDLKENAEYHAAKEAMSHLMERISVLESKIAKARIIDEQNIERDKVYIGASVTIKDIDEGDEVSYKIVDVEEANPSEGKISVQSPMAQGLLGHKAGEELKIDLPGGTMDVKVLKITR